MTETTADMDAIPEKQTSTETRDDSIVRLGDLTTKLQACRTRAEMDLEQAAVEMRLSASMLKALEAERFSELPDPPYVRGYLRSYARLDGSDPKDLIRVYEMLRGADPDSFVLPPSMSINRVTKPRISPGTVKLLGLAALVLLLGVLSMIPAVSQWATSTWNNFSAKTTDKLPEKSPALAASGDLPRVAGQTDTPATETTVQTTETPATNASTTSTSETTSGPVTSTAATTTSEPVILATTQQDSLENADGTTTLTLSALQEDKPMDAEETASPDAELANNDAEDPAASPATGETAAPTGTEPAAGETAAQTGTESPATPAAGEAASTSNAEATQAGQNTATETASTTTPTTPATDPASAVQTPPEAQQTATTDTAVPRQQPIDGEVLVRMEFTQEVWMQIKDANKKSIFEAVNAANTWKQFRARTPLSFKIGNSPGVRIFLNGQLFNQTPYTRGSVSRFTID